VENKTVEMVVKDLLLADNRKKTINFKIFDVPYALRPGIAFREGPGKMF